MIERIEKTTNNLSKKDFERDINLIDSTILRLQVIGETMKNIPFEIKKKNKQVRWRAFSKLRNFISHKYLQIDREIIWDFIQTQIPKLKKEIETIKNEIKN